MLLWSVVLLKAVCLVRAVPDARDFKIDIVYKPEVCERPSKYGDQMFVHFNGTHLQSGRVFDKSHEDKPFRFQMGIGEVITGFDQGLVDMCPGERRRLVVPPSMAYGHEGGHLPQMPGGTLQFDVELVHAEQGPRHPSVFKSMDTNKDNYLTKMEIVNYLRKEVKDAGGHPMTNEEEMQIVSDIFLIEDKNKDDYISHIEFSGPYHEEF